MATNLIVNGGFETVDSFLRPLAWQLGGSGFDGIYHPGHSGDKAAVVWRGDVGDPTPIYVAGSVSQSVTTTPGQWYQLDFWARSDNGTEDSPTVSFAGQTITLPAPSLTASWQEITVLVQAQGASSDLVFAQSLNSSNSTLLDDVSLTAYAPPVTATLFTWHGTLNGDIGNDTLTSVASLGVLNGLDGDDSLTGTGWADSLYGGDGNDHLTATGGSSSLDGGAGDDTINASGWGDSISGGDGNDQVTVNGDGAHITLGDGNNQIHVNGWGEVILAGNGQNQVDGVTGGASITLGNGGNTVTLSGSGNTVVTGTGNDVFTVGGQNNTVQGGAGDDVFNLGLGGSQVVDGGLGTDTVNYTGSAAQYHVTIHPDGSLTVSGPGGTDVLRGIETIHFAGGGADIDVGKLFAPPPPAANEVLFLANDGTHGIELWASDLSGNSHLVKDITPGAASSQILGLASLGSEAVFATLNVVAYQTIISIWESDGSAAGTSILTSLTFGASDGFFGQAFTPVGNGKAVFTAGGVTLEETFAYALALDGSNPV